MNRRHFTKTLVAAGAAATGVDTTGAGAAGVATAAGTATGCDTVSGTEGSPSSAEEIAADRINIERLKTIRLFMTTPLFNILTEIF